MAETRERIITATAELFRRQGYNGTSMKAVTEAADVPFGSLYHFFPDGKAQLAGVVIRSSGAAYRELFELIWAGADDAPSAVTDFFDGAAAVLTETDYVDACPIGTVALEVASTNDELRAATHEVFSSWVDAAAARFRGAGIDADRAAALATTFVAAVEGGFMLSRAARSPEPMRTAGRLVRELVAATPAAGPATPSRPHRSGAPAEH
ncbi:MAG: TetR/AcrR family transcriptional regulator [Actinomycetota bacterium]|nr:TetR/AcrR family transcriptional regulator [Actinomycetota bacterium]